MSALWLAALAAAGDFEWTPSGELRAIVSSGSDFAVDAEGTSVGQGAHLDTRLRAGLLAEAGAWRVGTEWDLLTGQLAGDTWDIPTAGDERRRDVLGAATLDGIRARKLSVGFEAGRTDLEVGLQTSHWGLGLLANDGDHEPLFGREDFGDRVVRAKVTTAPFSRDVPRPLFLVVAADLVVADEIGSLREGQVPAQGVVALMWNEGEGEAQRGVYTVFRQQWETRTDRATTVAALDAYASQPIDLSDAWTLRLAGEGVGIFGLTDRATTYNSRDGLSVAQLGLALRASVEHERIDLHLRGGYASADGHPDDKATTLFSADRDFDVGMVLFDEVQGALGAGARALLEDPQYAGQAPDGVELLTTEGAFQGATYVQPALALRPVAPVELRLGAVLAWANAPIAEPFYSYRAGGVPTNHLGQPTAGRALGTELDWAVRVQPGSDEALEGWALRPRLEVHGGHALLSEDLGGGVVHLIQGAIRAEW